MRLSVCIFAALTACLQVHAADDDGPFNEVEIIRPPVPAYPAMAGFFQIPGYCEVRFDLVDYGRNVRLRETSCTNVSFCAAAERAVQNAILSVTDVPGTKTPGARKNILYPISFQPVSFKGDIPTAPLGACPPPSTALTS